MQINLCPGCMEETAGFPCPRCGFDPANYQGSPDGLKLNSILHARYLIGRVLAQDNTGITYIGFDLANGAKVLIRELFMGGCARRGENGEVLWDSSTEAGQARKVGISTYLREGEKIGAETNGPRVLDVFEENGTAYTVAQYVENGGKKGRVKKEKKSGGKKGRIILIVLIVLLVAALAVAAIALLGGSDKDDGPALGICIGGHNWEEATCAAPKTCSRCGKTSGDPLEHTMVEATCDTPMICKVCGAQEGSARGHSYGSPSCEEGGKCSRCGAVSGAALGHDWKPATGTAPETCSRCGKTRGNVKGYLGDIPGSWNPTPVRIGPSRNQAYELSRTVTDCTKMTMYFKITYAQGWYQGVWRVYFRDLNGNWHDLQSFEVEPDSVGVERHITFEFDTPVTFDAIATCQANLSGCSWSMELGAEDVYVKE